MSEKPTASSLEKVEAILNNPAIYELARAIPGPAKSGRRRDYPTFMILVFNSLLSVWRSGRQVEAELSHPLVWRHMRRIVRRRFPDDPSMHLPQQPMRRHHYVYGRDRYLTDPAILERLGEIHRELATGQAKKAGLLDPEGPGSYTHPDLSRVLHADGKVVTPLFKARPGQFRVDTETGEVIPVRYETDAALHFEGDGEAAWGTKFVGVATRSHTGCTSTGSSLGDMTIDRSPLLRTPVCYSDPSEAPVFDTDVWATLSRGLPSSVRTKPQEQCSKGACSTLR